MTPVATVLWLCVLIFDTSGQLAFKAAASRAGHEDGLARWRYMLANYWIWIGVLSYVAEFFIWTAFLSLVPLSLGVLVGSVNILAVMIGGRLLFNEALTRKRMVGIAMIAVGVALVGWA